MTSEESFLETTTDQWRAALEGCNREDPGLTIAELAEKFRVPKSTIGDRVKKLLFEGKCTEGVGKRYDCRGSAYSARVYQLVKEEVQE